MDVDSGSVRKIRNRSGIDIDEIPARMQREQVAPAGLAPAAMAVVRLAEGADLLRSVGNLHCIRLPEGEGVDRAGRPAPARPAVAIPHRGRLAADGEPNGAAEAAPFVDLVVVHGFLRVVKIE